MQQRSSEKLELFLAINGSCVVLIDVVVYQNMVVLPKQFGAKPMESFPFFCEENWDAFLFKRVCVLLKVNYFDIGNSKAHHFLLQ
ncbi:MAG: hypothetical protein ABJK28_04255 [Algibacter sp.]